MKCDVWLLLLIVVWVFAVDGRGDRGGGGRSGGEEDSRLEDRLEVDHHL